MQKNKKLGWVGLGVMGGAMCQHLIDAGYTMAVYTRTKQKAEKMLDHGAVWCDSPRDVAMQSDVVFTMVGVEAEVRQVYFSEKGLLSTDIENKIFIDMGTTAPGLTLEMAEFANAHGAQTIDAPVSGGDVGAKNACLSIMAGGDESTINNLNSLFDCLGKVVLTGVTGSGQHTKMCNQIVVAGTMIGVCEALLYAKGAGLDPQQLIAAIRSGAAGCWTLDNLAPRIIQQDYSSGFMVEHFIKDLGIAVNQAEQMQLQLPGLRLAKSLYEKVRDMGHGKSATQALLLALEKSADKV